MLKFSKNFWIDLLRSLNQRKTNAADFEFQIQFSLQTFPDEITGTFCLKNGRRRRRIYRRKNFGQTSSEWKIRIFDCLGRFWPRRKHLGTKNKFGLSGIVEGKYFFFKINMWKVEYVPWIKISYVKVFMFLVVELFWLNTNQFFAKKHFILVE